MGRAPGFFISTISSRNGGKDDDDDDDDDEVWSRDRNRTVEHFLKPWRSADNQLQKAYFKTIAWNLQLKEISFVVINYCCKANKLVSNKLRALVETIF